jgi:hypothetical protein
MNHTSLLNTLKNKTVYTQINAVLDDLVAGVLSLTGDKLIGIYLFGSLACDDFYEKSSDVDLTVVLQEALNNDAIDAIQSLHQALQFSHQPWGARLECSYTHLAMLSSMTPPPEPRPYCNNGVFYESAHYGNEWIINNYLLIHHSIALLGPDFKTLIPSISIEEVQKACVQDLFLEWIPKIGDTDWMNRSDCQVYLILNLCRILFTVSTAKTASKTLSANWVKNTYGS